MSLTVAVTARPAGSPPAVRVVVTSSSGSDSREVEVYRTHPDGTVEKVLGSGPHKLVGGVWLIEDYHAPLNLFVKYHAVADVDVAPQVSAFLPSARAWIIPASNPGNAVPVEYVIDGVGDRTVNPKVGIFRKAVPPGGTQPRRNLIISDGSTTVDRNITFAVSPAAAIRFEEQGVAAGPFLINLIGGWDDTWMWAMAAGAVSIRNTGEVTMRGGKADYPYREVSFAYVLAETPDVGSTGVWTDAQAEAYWTSLGKTDGDMETYYASALDRETDTRIA